MGAVFGQGETGGLADLLFGRTSVDDALVDAPGYGDWLRLLLPGDARPIDLLEPRRIAEIIDQLKREADVVVVDSPPLTEFADALRSSTRSTSCSSRCVSDTAAATGLPTSTASSPSIRFRPRARGHIATPLPRRRPHTDHRVARNAAFTRVVEESGSSGSVARADG